MKQQKILKSAYVSAFTLALLSSAANAKPATPKIKMDGAAVPYTVLQTTKDGVEVRCGGYGSDACAHPTDKDKFYLITDRGPNIDFEGNKGKGKLFPNPEFTPRIGLFQIQKDGSVKLLKEILLKDPNGNLISGLPNPKGKGATGEIAYDLQGNVLGTDDYGLDSEGIVAMKDGTFYISDEYGPHIVHYDANGVELERISPYGMTTGNRHLPKVFERRRANRGMEGLALNTDGKTLVGIMQSTMHNPSKKELGNKRVVRIVTFDIETSQTHQYLYLQEPDTDSCSGITTYGKDEFVVIERDGKFLGDGNAKKCLYKMSLKGATDVSGDFESEGGMLIGGKTIEQCTVEELQNAGIKFVQKTLIADLAKKIKYEHDKLEGVWLLDKNTIAVANDNDFALLEKDNKLIQKKIPGTAKTEDDVIYTIQMK